MANYDCLSLKCELRSECDRLYELVFPPCARAAIAEAQAASTNSGIMAAPKPCAECVHKKAGHCDKICKWDINDQFEPRTAS